MTDIQNMAMKIFNAYEDLYLDKQKSKIFEELFDKFLPKVDKDGKSDTYDALVALGLNFSADFDHIVKVLKDQQLITE